MPGSVMRCRGRVGSGSSLRRSWFMYWRNVMGLGEVARPPHRVREWTLANELAGVTRQHLQHLPFGRCQVQGLGGAHGLFPCHCWAASRCKAHARINAAFALTRSLVSVSTMRASCSVLNRWAAALAARMPSGMMSSASMAAASSAVSNRPRYYSPWWVSWARQRLRMGRRHGCLNGYCTTLGIVTVGESPGHPMGKDKTPTSRSDQSKSAVAIAANATVVRKSVRRPRPTPVGGAGIDLSPEAFCCCVFHGVKSREMTPGGENLLVAYLLSHLAKTRFFPKLSAAAFSDHWTSTPRVSVSKATASVAITCPTPAACALLVVTGTPNSRPGRRIVGQRKGAQRRSCWTVRAPHLPNLSGAERTPTLYIRPPRAWSRPLRSVASTLVAYACV